MTFPANGPGLAVAGGFQFFWGARTEIRSKF